MKFETIRITGGQVDAADPRTDPGAVQAAHIKQSPVTLPNSDAPPTVAAITLEGTAGQQATVQQFALDETGRASDFGDAVGSGPPAAERQFYAVAAAVVVTVGTIAYQRAVAGQVYYRITTAPAADAVLKIGFLSGAP